ncbi:MAG: ATP-binding cassette domain-containing protein, partial [Chloroflexota bacterium]
ASRVDVLRAAEAAGVSSFVDCLEDGFQTIVSERGTTLSGGQRQCVAVARAMLRDSPIVIMDEPTSSMDVATERLVNEGIRQLAQRRTMIVIAHRFSTVQQADTMAVLEAGRLVRVGPPSKLMTAQDMLTQPAPALA